MTWKDELKEWSIVAAGTLAIVTGLLGLLCVAFWLCDLVLY